MTTRFSISSGGKPPYCQTTATTGMSISGKMSVDMRRIVTTPKSTIKTAITTKV